MRSRLALAVTPLIALAALCVSHAARAATLSVGPGKTYAKPCDAIKAAQAGDTIEVDASGNYAGDACSWTTDNLTVKGVNGRAKIDDTGMTVAEHKGIFVIYAPTATIENMEFVGASIPDTNPNGAGIRHQGLNLVVRNCSFHDNQDGILGVPLSGGSPALGQGSVLVESSEFYNNGLGQPGYTHNMYIGEYGSFTLQYSYSHSMPGNGGDVGHLVKTRADKNLILYNRITGETGSKESYSIDVSQGGTAFIIGNLIEQSATSLNPAIVAYAKEGVVNPDDHLFFVNNTVVNDATGGTFVTIGGAVKSNAVLVNNVFKGPGTIVDQAGAMQTTNWSDAMGDPKLMSPASYDYHLLAGSPCVDKGTDPGMAMGQALAPIYEYVHPLSYEGRAVAGTAIDIGAYELGGATSADAGPMTDSGGPVTTRPDSGPDLGDGGLATGVVSSDAGCGCDVVGERESAGAAMVSLGITALFGARRRRRARSM